MKHITQLLITLISITNMCIYGQNLSLNQPMDIKLRVSPSNPATDEYIHILADITYIVGCNGEGPIKNPGTTVTESFYDHESLKGCEYYIIRTQLWKDYPTDSCSLKTITDTVTQFEKITLPECYNKIIYTIPASLNKPQMSDTLIIDLRSNDILNVKKEDNINFNIYPNPLNSNSVISFELDKPSKCQVSIFNAIGCKVIEVVNSELIQGYHYYNIIPTSLPSGYYICHARIGDKNIVTRCIKK